MDTVGSKEGCSIYVVIKNPLYFNGFLPQTYVKLESDADLKNMEKLIDHLEDNDDVQNVYHNWDQE